MNSSPTQFIPSGSMGFYEPVHQIGMWNESFKANGIPNMYPSSFMVGNLNASASIIMPPDTKFENQSEDTSQGTLGACQFDQEASKPAEKIKRRLAQNREAARKSRLRKKAYVKQLETSRLKLIQLEQELQRARQQAGNNLQGAYLGGAVEASSFGYSGIVAPGVATFEGQYSTWVDQQNKLIFELRTALNGQRTEIEIHSLVKRAMSHYNELFRMKSMAAEADVFYLLFGMWKTPAERFFLWIGGFRPSELLKIIKPQLHDLTEKQYAEVCNLERTCQQAEDAFTQGMDKLKHTLAESVAAGQLDKSSNFSPREGTAMDKLDGLVRFVQQADHIRQESLKEMSKILNVRQAARGLLALGEYFHRLRGLSLLLANRGSCRL